MAVDLKPDAAAAPAIAERLRAVHAGLRHDLEVTRHLFRGVATYLFRDPISFQTHAFDAGDYQVLMALTEERPLGEVFERLVADGLLREEDEGAFYGFVLTLHRLGFLALPISDSQGSFRRFESRRRAGRLRLLLGPLFLRIPLINPDRFLVRTLPLAGWLFSRPMLVVWIALMATCGWIAWTLRGSFGEALPALLGLENLVLLWIALVALKVVHEFGHAYACRRFGGAVPEMGVFMIVLTPCAYMDASASWGFTSRWQRIVVALGGVYFESFTAAAALLTWASTDPGVVNGIAFQVLVLSSVTTVVFNLNPLLRYDGYFILCDLLSTPNLRARSNTYLLGLIKRAMLGLPGEAAPRGAAMRVTLVVYAIASTVYRTLMIVAIATLLALKVPLVGMAIGVTFVGSMVISSLRKALRYLWRSPETAPVRRRAVLASLLLVGGVPALVGLVPMPGTVRADGVVRPGTLDDVVAEADAIVAAVAVEPGSAVRSDEVLVVLEQPELDSTLAALEAAATEAAIETEAARTIGPHEVHAREAVHRHRRAAADLARGRWSALNVRAGANGLLLSGLGPTDLGRFVRAGETVAVVGSGAWNVTVMLAEREVADLDVVPGRIVECRSPAMPGALLCGVVEQVAPVGQRTVPEAALTVAGGGAIVVDPITGHAAGSQYELTVRLDGPPPAWLRPGMTLDVRLSGPPRTLATHARHAVLRFMQTMATAR